MIGKFRAIAVVMAAAVIVFVVYLDHNHGVAVKPGGDLLVAATGPSLGPPMERAVVIKPTSSEQIGRQITAGSHVDVLAASTRHGSTTLRSLFPNMEVLSVSSSGGMVTLRALTPRQAGRLVYASGNDRLVVRLQRTVKG